MRLLPLLALLLFLAGPSAGKKGKKARGKKAAAKAREVEVTFTEPGPLGLDFMPEKLSGGRVGLKVKGIAPGSHASQFAQLGAGMRLVSVADDSGGVTVHTEMSAASGPELAALAKTALGDTRPITVRFSGSLKKVQPGDATALIQEGTRLGQQGRLPEAVATMERAVALKPDLAEAHYNLGIGYDRAKPTPPVQKPHPQYTHSPWHTKPRLSPHRCPTTAAAEAAAAPPPLRLRPPSGRRLRRPRLRLRPSRRTSHRRRAGAQCRGLRGSRALTGTPA